jgi:hypothetical protein
MAAPGVFSKKYGKKKCFPNPADAGLLPALGAESSHEKKERGITRW